MRRPRLPMSLLFVLLITGAVAMAAEPIRLTLTRDERPSRILYGLTPFKYDGISAGKPYWGGRLANRELLFELAAEEDFQFKPLMYVRIDGKSGQTLRGSVIYSWRLQAEMIEFEPFLCRSEKGDLTLTVKLVKYMNEWGGGRWGDEWRKVDFPWAPAALDLKYGVYKNWAIVVGNAEALSTPFQARGNPGYIWLIDGDNDGSFKVRRADQQSGDYLLWVYGGKQNFDGGGGGPLLPKMMIADREYLLELAYEGQEATLILTPTKRLDL